MTNNPSFFHIDNTNTYQQSKFRIVFESLPFLTYFCQGSMLPDIQADPIKMENPFDPHWHAGDKLQFSNLDVSVILDEDMQVWKETFKWMRGLYFPNEHLEYYNQLKKGLYHDATVIVMKNSNTENFRIKYTNCFPISMTRVSFERDVDANLTPKFDITFRYDQFYFEDVLTNPLI